MFNIVLPLLFDVFYTYLSVTATIKRLRYKFEEII